MGKGSTHGVSWDAHTGFADDATYWQDTDPTSTLISIGTHSSVNQSSETFVIYCWAEIAQFSKFGHFQGNGNADGTFYNTEMTPAFHWSQVDAVAHTYVGDNARNPSNPRALSVRLCEDEGEVTDAARDFLSNGVKFRDADGQYYCSFFTSWAEEPFTYDGVGQGRAK